MSPSIGKDNRGIPVLFADKRENLPEIVTPDATSGPAEWGRYHDAVREASRTYDNPGESEIRQFVHARARSPERVDVPAFHEAVKRQRMADLVDIMDHHMRRDGSLPRGSRHIRVQAPKNYLRKALRDSSPEELAHLHHRMTSIGHDGASVSNYISSRVEPDMWDQASTIQVHLADDEFDGLVFSADDPEVEWDDPVGDVVEAVARVYESLPPPTINVYINNTNKEDE